MKGNENVEKVYEYIQSYWKENAASPTVREICSSTDIKSTSTVHNIIRKLIAAGRIEPFEPGSPRMCTPVISSSDTIRFCPFCGSTKCPRIEAKEYKCGDCGSIFIVMKREV